jgi:hypothetical protein
MALIGGGWLNGGGGPSRWRNCGISTITEIKGVWSDAGSYRNFYAGQGSMDAGVSIADKSGYPSGYRHPASWSMPIKPGGLSSRNEVTGTGTISANAWAVKLAEAALSGQGGLTAFGSLIVQLIAALTGSGTISNADVKAFLAAVANLSGSGGVTVGDLEGLGALIAALVGSGTATGSTLSGTGALDADITVTGTGLSTANVGQAVWSALAAANNVTGTMGEKLNDAGAAGNPWAALIAANNDPDTFGELVQQIATLSAENPWAALLSANNDPATFGKLIQDLQVLVDELHKLQGLDISNPMTVTPTSRTAGTIEQEISGDGMTTSTVTRTT